MKNRTDSTTGCKCPGKCFCKYDADDLVSIVYKKRVKGISTVDLVSAARSSREIEFVSVVALLDLNEADADMMIKEHMAGSSCDVLACRNYLRSKIDDALKAYSPTGEDP